MKSPRVLYQYLLPQHLLSALMYKIARCKWRLLKNFLISRFIRIYDVDMNIAERTSADEYICFNDFFTRSLTPGARPVSQDADEIVSPVDGVVSAAGSIQENQLFQAKGLNYSLEKLLGNDTTLLQHFLHGNFVTLYLSPRDYHRIHMPCSGRLESMKYIPGSLFSVNTTTTNQIQDLFARNERVICVFDTSMGKLAVIMVGAIFVGSMETVWHGQITPARPRQENQWDYLNEQDVVELAKGAELGRFNMGSTVILLLEKGKSEWLPGVEPGQWFAMGSPVARIT